MENNTIINKPVYISNLLPFICALIIYKATVNYYYFLFPSFTPFWKLLYQAITLFCLIIFPIMFIVILLSKKPFRWKLIYPSLLIPISVLINTFLVVLQEGTLEVLSRSYLIENAKSTVDYMGFYFAGINTWFGNIGIMLLMTYFVNNKKVLTRCLIYSLFMFVIPILLLILLHPELIGQRKSQFGNIVFGGGVWNIGICAFGSLAWLAIAQIYEVSKRQKKFIVLSIILFCFAGIVGLSRTFVLMLVLSFSYYAMFLRNNKTWIKVLRASFLFIVLMLLLNPETIIALMSRFIKEHTAGTNNVRFTLWKSYFKYIGDYFWFGALSGSVYNYYLYINWKGRHFLPHSSILNFWTRFGIFSVVGYLLTIKNAATKLIVKKDYELSIYKKKCLKAWVISYVALSFFNQTGFAEIEFYLGFGLIFALINLENRAIQNVEKQRGWKKL